MTDKTLRDKVRSLVGNSAISVRGVGGAQKMPKSRKVVKHFKGSAVPSKGDAKFRRFTFDQRQAFRARRAKQTPFGGPKDGRPNTGKTPPYPGIR